MATCTRCDGKGVLRANQTPPDGRYEFRKISCSCARGQIVGLTAERDALRGVLNRALAVADDLGVEELGWMRDARELLKEGSTA